MESSRVRPSTLLANTIHVSKLFIQKQFILWQKNRKKFFVVTKKPYCNPTKSREGLNQDETSSTSQQLTNFLSVLILIFIHSFAYALTSTLMFIPIVKSQIFLYNLPLLLLDTQTILIDDRRNIVKLKSHQTFLLFRFAQQFFFLCHFTNRYNPTISSFVN